MKRKLLVICGSTATGKTACALSLAKKFNGEIISADSRQIYKGMNIGTGKDLPENAKFQITNDKWGKYVISGISVWGLDLVDPKEEFSVSHYIQYANTVLENIWSRNKLAILVGGTGFYIKALIDGIETLDVPKNSNLRPGLQKLSVSMLFEKILENDPSKAKQMNTSDRKNPARLIRAIEVSLWKITHKTRNNIAKKLDAEVLHIGLTLSKEALAKRIEKRVLERVAQGVEHEIKSLLEKGVTWDMQSMNTLGYKEWKNYFDGGKETNSVIEDWIIDEQRYAKRQRTWFKKDKRIEWFDVSKPGLQRKVEKFVNEWHNT